MRLRQTARPLCAFALLACVAGVEAEKRALDLAEASLEELMNLEVTSVAKKEQRLSQAAAAIYVITNEDIRRSGFTSIPEALRMAPGLQVARISATEWAITARGFTSKFPNKLLVLIDGRSVYTPLYSGVYWDVQNLLLEDVERIEVIRGPGATMWGANAVNGVINIITKPAKETQGGLLAAAAGREDELGSTGIRYGGRFGSNAHYRVSSGYFRRGQLYNQSAEGPENDRNMLHGASRMDWEFSERNSLTVQGGAYKGGATVAENTYFLAPPSLRIINQPTTESGGNFLARWRHVSSESSDMSLQLYYDRTRRYNNNRSEYLDAFDADFQHRFRRLSRHEFLWGMGWRITTDGANNTLGNSYDPNVRTDQLVSAFLQDEIQILPERFTLTVGSKFEHNDYTGFEVQPGVRAIWTPSRRHSLWAAVSRAVRTPARSDHDRRRTFGISVSGGMPNLRVRIGDAAVRSEALRAHELGYRFMPSSTVSLDLATFYNVYGHLITYEPRPSFRESTPPPEHIVTPQYESNLMHAESYGAEIAANWSVVRSWRLGGSYSWLRMQLHRDPASGDTTAERPEGESPRHQFQVHSYLDLPRKLSLSTFLYYVSSLSARNIPAYTRVDVRLGWRFTPALGLSLVGQDLLDNHHPEFSSASSGQSSEVVRSAYAKLTWRF